jgi:uncharacterized protein
MRHLKRTDHRRMRWKNGKGETVEIAVEPPHATVDTFDWRVSLAAVVEDGPFSCFHGVDRTLAVVRGGDLALRLADGPVTALRALGPPLSFPADVPCEASLHGDAVTDLNVMTRRGVWTHRLQRLLEHLPVAQTAHAAILVAAPEAATVVVDGAVVELAPEDALRLSPNRTVTLLGGTAWLAQFDRV